jgi:arylsulfatase A-like enzyme
MNRTLAIGTLIIIGVAVVGLTSLLPHRLRPGRPCAESCNVVLIMVDTLSADHLAAYGYERDTMPKTEAFFRERGIVFENAYSAAPWTYESFPALYFSEVSSNLTFADLMGQTNRATLQSALREAGYNVRGMLLYPAIFILDTVARPFLPEERLAANPSSNAPIRTQPLSEYIQHVNERRLYDRMFGGAAQAIRTLDAERTESGKPFFLMLHTFLAHDPYETRAPYNTAFEDRAGDEFVTMNDLLTINDEIRAGKEIDPDTRTILTLRYDQSILETDEYVSTLLASIPEETLQRTVVILSSDHGEAFQEHELFWHGNNLHEEELRVPLFIAVPGFKPNRISEPVSLLDLAPTILSLAGVKVPETFTGKNLIPLMEGKTLGDRPIKAVFGFPFFLDVKVNAPMPPASLEAAGIEDTSAPSITTSDYSVRMGGYKIIETLPSEGEEGKKMLYNLDEDPGETVNLLEGDLSFYDRYMYYRLSGELEKLKK